jgi:DNA-binding MarR family transcriptional regulator
MMTKRNSEEIESVLNAFAEVMSRLMIDQHQKQITALELTLLQVQGLRVLRRGPAPTGKFAAELGISASAVTQLTDRLIRKGLIERQAAADDRRSVLVALSAKGKRMIDAFRKRRTYFFSEALKQLSEPEHVHVIEAMTMVIRALESYKPKGGLNHGFG